MFPKTKNGIRRGSILITSYAIFIANILCLLQKSLRLETYKARQTVVFLTVLHYICETGILFTRYGQI